MKTAPKRLQWLAFFPEDYGYLLTATTEEIAFVFKDLITVALSGKVEDAEVVINQKTLEKSKAMWISKKDLKEIAKEKRRLREERPTRETVLQFAKEVGIRAEHAEEFYKFAQDNDWRDGEGYPIQNWCEALRFFDRYMTYRKILPNHTRGDV
jgi:hypothetical protein